MEGAGRPGAGFRAATSYADDHVMGGDERRAGPTVATSVVAYPFYTAFAATAWWPKWALSVSLPRLCGLAATPFGPF
jgi:hypothetical protein